ncbi:uncharacterized protein LY79DRAFT_537288 [Colletotrichum navitas]|uniref:Uncharacterized protein n=1 Tax=Colletotrichum navitas TaxID=681940 RepID=A0AAD8QCP8_9PEZI|nr:uncharacterized protein LY79DRAFT_537288 [Colletotrichum navitas]KAK1599187.1 hypothetical protein LY79DRAFT_537288 [Colletotrichum navitas]
MQVAAQPLVFRDHPTLSLSLSLLLRLRLLLLSRRRRRRLRRHHRRSRLLASCSSVAGGCSSPTLLFFRGIGEKKNSFFRARSIPCFFIFGFASLSASPLDRISQDLL